GNSTHIQRTTGRATSLHFPAFWCKRLRTINSTRHPCAACSIWFLRAYLPIGAYQATLAGKPVWIVAVKWEYPTTEMGTLPLGHIRAFAFDQKTLSRVA